MSGSAAGRDACCCAKETGDVHECQFFSKLVSRLAPPQVAVAEAAAADLAQKLAAAEDALYSADKDKARGTQSQNPRITGHAPPPMTLPEPQRASRKLPAPRIAGPAFEAEGARG